MVVMTLSFSTCLDFRFVTNLTAISVPHKCECIGGADSALSAPPMHSYYYYTIVTNLIAYPCLINVNASAERGMPQES